MHLCLTKKKGEEVVNIYIYNCLSYVTKRDIFFVFFQEIIFSVSNTYTH